MKTRILLFTIFWIAGLNALSQIILPYTESFETIGPVLEYSANTDSINGIWDFSYEKTNDGRLRFNAGAAYCHTGSYAATLDAATNGVNSENYLILSLDLTRYYDSDNMLFSFYFMEHGEENNTNDKVWIRKSTTATWEEVYSFDHGNTTNGQWNYLVFDLDSIFDANGFNTNSIYSYKSIQIKFGQEDNYQSTSTTASDGLTIDDISITGSPSPIILPYTEGFERIGSTRTFTSTESFINGIPNWSYQNVNNGRIRFDAGEDYYNSGNHAATMDCDAYNATTATNVLTLTLNLTIYSNSPDLELAFSFMNHGDEVHTNDKVFVRGNILYPWVEVYDMGNNHGPNGTWNHVSGVDIDQALTDAGQNITTSFQIAFGQQDDYPSTSIYGSDGITIDDVEVSCKYLRWTGNMSENLYNPNNYEPNLEPTAKDDVIIQSSATNMPKSFGSSANYFTCRDLIIEAGADVQFNKIHATCFYYIFGSLRNYGNIRSKSGNKVKIYKDITGTGTFNFSDADIELIGNEKSIISCSNDLSIKFLDISKTIGDRDGIKYIGNNNLEVSSLTIYSGCFLTESTGRLTIGNTWIKNNCGLQISNPIDIILEKGFTNDNTSVTDSTGFSCHENSSVFFDTDFPNQSIKCGEGTHEGSEFHTVYFLSTDEGWTLNSDMCVKKEVHFLNGIIKTNEHIFIVEEPEADAIAIFSDNSYISGNLRRYITNSFLDYSLPVGTDDNLERVDLLFSSISGGLSYIDVSFTETNSETPPPGLNVNGTEITEFLDHGYWTITPNTGSADYDITLTSRGHTNGGASTDQHAIFKRSGAGPWEDLGNHDNGTQSGTGNNPITVTRSGLSGFSDFIIGRSIAHPLPINLKSFEASCKDDHVEIKWITSSEINNDYFTLEKSKDGIVFEVIDIIDGAGNSNTENIYTTLDQITDSEHNFYRLKQTDYNGDYSYSDIINSSCMETITNEINNIWLNNDNIYFEMYSSSINSYNVYMYDESGRKIFNTNVMTDTGLGTYNIEAPELCTGIYIVVFQSGSDYITKKIIIN